MKIVTIHPYYMLERKYFGANVMIFNKIIDCRYEARCLKKPQQNNFVIEGQQWMGFKNPYLLYLNLYKKAKTIDILHMYHIYRYSLLGAIIYKLRNPKGKVYIKMDMPLFKENTDNRLQLKKIPKIIMKLFLSLVEYVGFEDKILQNFMKEIYPKYKNKFIFTVNGTVTIPKFIGNLKKENIISLCGRFGSQQKNNELLLSILKKHNIDFLKGYKIQLIGSYTKEFLKKIDELIILKPELKGIIIKVGFLEKKEELYRYLSKSKIFLHTANYEGDPNIQYDAMFCGCFMISTDVANIKQNYLSEYSLFYDIKSEKGLYDNLKKGIEINDKLKQQDYINIQNYCLEKFTWEKSLQELTEKLGNFQS